MKTFYATTPIYYVNDLPHIGHIYTTVVTDTATRFHRLVGEKTRFLTGTDEHGQNIEKAAADQGITPIALADRVVARYHDLWKKFDISNDDFIRTTETRHLSGVEALIARIEAAGDFYTAKHEGWYCASCEAFYTEKELDARSEVPGPRNRLRLGVGGERLLPAVEVRGAAPRPLREAPRVRPPGDPPRRDGLVRRGGTDGPLRVPVEGQVGHPVSGRPGHVVYVWLDALANYITALGFGSAGRPPLPGVLGEPGGPARPPRRQGHPAVPCRLLAGVPPLGGAPAADDGLGARLVAARRQEDVQVGRQRRAARRPRRAVRPGRSALLPPAGDDLRAGRELLRRGVPDPLQRGPRQRPRQHGLARRRACAGSPSAELPMSAAAKEDPRSGLPRRMRPSGARRWRSSRSTAPSKRSGAS